MVTPEVEPEAVFRYAVAVIAAALTPSAVILVPRTGAGLAKTAAHLPLVLWDAAMVDASIGRAVGLDAAVIDAAVGLLRFGLTLRRFASLLMLLLRGLLTVLLCGLPLLMLLPLLRFALLLTLLLVLCRGRNSGSEKQEQNCCADNVSSFHLSVLLIERECSVAAQSFFTMLVGCDLEVCPIRITSPEVPLPFSETSRPKRLE